MSGSYLHRHCAYIYEHALGFWDVFNESTTRAMSRWEVDMPWPEGYRRFNQTWAWRTFPTSDCLLDDLLGEALHVRDGTHRSPQRAQREQPSSRSS